MAKAENGLTVASSVWSLLSLAQGFEYAEDFGGDLRRVVLDLDFLFFTTLIFILLVEFDVIYFFRNPGNKNVSVKATIDLIFLTADLTRRSVLAFRFFFVFPFFIAVLAFYFFVFFY